MSKEVKAPIINSYRGDAESPVELPEHLRLYGENFDTKGYGAVWHKPGATKAERKAHEAEMAAVWNANKDLENLFQTVSSEDFNSVHREVIVQGMSAQATAEQLLGAIPATGNAARRQVNIEAHRALKDEATHQSERMLPINQENAKDEEMIGRQRAVLAELLTSDIVFSKSGKILKRKPKVFDEQLSSWRKYEQLAVAVEIERLHAEALKANRWYNSYEHRQHHKNIFESLDSEHDGLFNRIWSLPLDRYGIPEEGGQKTSLKQIADKFHWAEAEVLGKEEVKEVTDRAKEGRIDGSGIATRMLAAQHLEPALKAVEERYKAQGFTGPDLQERVDEATDDLVEWLSDGDMRWEYIQYDRSRTAFEMRSKQAGKITLRVWELDDYIENLRSKDWSKAAIAALRRETSRLKKDATDEPLPKDVRSAMRTRKLDSAKSTPRAAAAYSSADKKRRRFFSRRPRPSAPPSDKP